MNTPEFIELVRRMREAQRLYFAKRDPQVLQESKRLERQVDLAIVELIGGPHLFTGADLAARQTKPDTEV